MLPGSVSMTWMTWRLSTRSRSSRRLALLPPETGIAIASRTPLDPAARSRLGVYERGPQDLALEEYPIARILAEEYAVLDPEAAGRVLALTAGWPALVHFAADALARQHHADLSQALTRPGSAAATWITSISLDGLPDAVRDVLDVLADLGTVTPGLCARLWADGGGEPAIEAMHQLRRMGVLVPLRRLGAGDLLYVVPVVASVLAEGRQATLDAELLRTAALAYEDEGLAFPACQSHARAGDWKAVEHLVVERGEDMLRQGDARGVADLLGDRPAGTWPPLVQRIHADALAISGDAAAATVVPFIRSATRQTVTAGSRRWRPESRPCTTRRRTSSSRWRRSTGSTLQASRPTCTASSGGHAA